MDTERGDTPEEEMVQHLQTAYCSDIRKPIEMHFMSVWVIGSLSQDSVTKLNVRVRTGERTHPE